MKTYKFDIEYINVKIKFSKKIIIILTSDKKSHTIELNDIKDLTNMTNKFYYEHIINIHDIFKIPTDTFIKLFFNELSKLPYFCTIKNVNYPLFLSKVYPLSDYKSTIYTQKIKFKNNQTNEIITKYSTNLPLLSSTEVFIDYFYLENNSIIVCVDNKYHRLFNLIQNHCYQFNWYRNIDKFLLKINVNNYKDYINSYFLLQKLIS